MKIVVTGAKGLLGWHAAARLHAENCDAKFRGDAVPYELILVERKDFADARGLANALEGAEAVLHFAGVNRGSDADVAQGNPAIALELTQALQATGTRPHIVYANSTHARGNSIYGQSKREAADILSRAGTLANFLLPHIFGECARSDYNNVTATLIDRLWKGETPTINPGGQVELLHAGTAADAMIAAATERREGEIAVEGRPMSVADLWSQLRRFHAEYLANTFPALDDSFDEALFNCYRTGGFPYHYPRNMTVRADSRGDLFETAKGRSESQSFVSTTRPGQSRGDHFHLSLVERFLVVSGEAVIRVRRVLTDEVHEFRVSGSLPQAIDMPPLHTHHIQNEGSADVVTFFWANRLFDPKNSDTYADPVYQTSGAHEQD